MDRRARSTAMTTPAGSVAVPVASACEASAASVCRSASVLDLLAEDASRSLAAGVDALEGADAVAAGSSELGHGAVDAADGPLGPERSGEEAGSIAGIAT